jgi:hypothetical protein
MGNPIGMAKWIAQQHTKDMEKAAAELPSDFVNRLAIAKALDELSQRFWSILHHIELEWEKKNGTSN